MATMDFMDALINSESGGRLDANYTDKKGRSYDGLFQMGKARLTDLGLGKDFTMDEYLSSEKLQRELGAKHFADIGRFIDANLSDAIGTEINGQPLTREAMMSIAHLGGKTGLQRYVQTGGKYNPSDELGTNLSDYHRKFEGSVMSASNERNTPTLGFGADVPLMDDPMKPGSENSLRTFASGMQISSDMIGGAVERVNKRAEEATEHARRLVTGQPLDVDDQKAARTRGEATNGANPTQLGMPAGVPAATNPALPNGQPMLGGTPVPPPAPPEAAASVSTNSGAPAAEEPQGFVDGMLAKIFPNREAGDRRTAGSDILAGLSQGLGQMSTGRPVDLSSTFNRMQARKTAAADQEQRAKQLEVDNFFKAQNLDIARQNANTATAKAAATTRSAQAEADGYSFSPEELALFAANPAYAGLAAQLDHPEAKVRQKAYEGIVAAQTQQAKDAIEGSSADPDARQNMATAYETFVDPTSTPEERAAAVASLSEDQIDRLVKLPNVDPTAGIQDADAYMNGTPEYREAVDRLKRMGAGTPTDENMDRAFRNQYGQDLFRQYAKNVENASVIDAPLAQVLAGQETLIREGASDDDMTRMFNDVVGSGIRSVSSMLGRNVTADQFMQEQFNIDSDALAQLDNAEKTLLFTIGQQMLAKQGSVSDGERRMAADAILSANGNPEAKMRAVAHLQVANSMDKAIYDYFKENSSAAFQNSMELEQEINTMFRNLSVPLGDALSAHYTFDNAYGLSESSTHTKLLDQIATEQAEGYEGPTPATDEYYKRTSPLMSDDVAQRIGKYLPRRIEYYKKQDADTGEITFVKMPRR